MSAAFQPSLMMMQRPLGSSTAFSIDSLIGSPPPPAPGHFVYTGYPMFMPYRPVVLPPPPPALPQAALQPPLPPAPPPPLPALPGAFCPGLAQGMALTSTLMAALPGSFPASPPRPEAARKFAPPGNFDKAEGLPPPDGGGGDDGKTGGGLLPFPAADTVHASLGECGPRGGDGDVWGWTPGLGEDWTAGARGARATRLLNFLTSPCPEKGGSEPLALTEPLEFGALRPGVGGSLLINWSI